MPIYQDLSLIEKKNKKKDRVLNPEQWTQVITNSRQTQPFEICYVEHPFTKNLEDGRTIIFVKIFKKLQEIFRRLIPTQGIRKITFGRSKKPRMSLDYSTQPNRELNLYVDGTTPQQIIELVENCENAYNGNFLPVPANVVRDVEEY